MAKHKHNAVLSAWVEYAQLDTNELTIIEVLKHKGNPEQPSTMIISCRCKQSEELVDFAFRSCKHVGVVKDYIKMTPGLKPLTSSVHYSLQYCCQCSDTT